MYYSVNFMINLKHKIFGITLSIFPIAIIVIPIIFLIIFSLVDNNFVSFPITKLSFRWYESLTLNKSLTNSIMYSILISSLVGILSILLGFLSGYWLARSKNTLRKYILLIMTIPAIVPFIIFGLGFLEFSKLIGIERTGLSIIIAHSVIFSPLAMNYFYFKVKNLNEDLENAARELGAKEFNVLLLVLGQIFNSVIACFVVIFVLSWDEYIVSWFVSGFQKTYAVHVRNMLESTFSPEVFSIGTIVAFISFIVILIGYYYSFNRKSKFI